MDRLHEFRNERLSAFFLRLVTTTDRDNQPANCYCQLLLVLTVSGRWSFSVLLCSKANNQSNHAPRQHDLKVVTANCVLRGQKSEQRADGETKQKTERQRVKLLCKKTDCYTGDDSFEGRANYNCRQLVSDCRSEPRS